MVTRRGRVYGRGLLRLSIFLTFVAGCASCASLLDFERLIEEVAEVSPTAPPESGEAGGTTALPVEGGRTCTDLGISTLSTGDAGNAGDAAPPGDIELAVRLLDFGIDPNAELVGFNLDRACSTTSDTSTCKTGIDDPTFIKYVADKNGRGLDNASFALLAYLASLGDSFSPSGIRNRLVAGEFGVVIRILSDGMGCPTTPRSGSRYFRYQQVLTDNSRIKSASAYVVGGRLVASFPSVTLGISVPDDPKPLDMHVQEAFFTGLLVPSETSWRVDQAVLGGRWRTADFLDQVRTIYVKDTPPLKRNVLCDPGFGTVVYEQVKNGADGRIHVRNRDSNKPHRVVC